MLMQARCVTRRRHFDSNEFLPPGVIVIAQLGFEGAKSAPIDRAMQFEKAYGWTCRVPTPAIEEVGIKRGWIPAAKAKALCGIKPIKHFDSFCPEIVFKKGIMVEGEDADFFESSVSYRVSEKVQMFRRCGCFGEHLDQHADDIIHRAPAQFAKLCERFLRLAGPQVCEFHQSAVFERAKCGVVIVAGQVVTNLGGQIRQILVIR